MSAELERIEIAVVDDEIARLRHRSFRLPLLLLAAIAVAGVIWKLRQPIDPPVATRPNTAVPVVLATATQVDVSDHVAGIGTVQASATATVRVRVDGQLQQISFIEGQDVQAGDVLAQLDPRALQAQLATAEAQLARGQATLENSRVDLQRYAGLVEQKSIAKQTLDTQKALVAQHEAALRADEAGVEYARVQLDYATIRAPIGGRTGVRLIDVGNLARASEATAIVVINQIDPITLSFTLPEATFARVNDALKRSKSLRVQAFSNDGNQPLAEGKLLLVNNQIDAASGTIQLKAEFPNQEHRLWPGQYINARLVLGETRAALVVPASAVQRGPEGTFVYVVNGDDTVSLSNVKVARTQDDKALISSGLQAGQRVVAEGQSKLRPGSAVIARAGPAP